MINQQCNIDDLDKEIKALESRINKISQEIAEINKKAHKTIVDGKESFSYELQDGDPDCTSLQFGGLTYPSYLKSELRKLKEKHDELLAKLYVEEIANPKPASMLCSIC
jgi:chromosome segregation ATPase